MTNIETTSRAIIRVRDLVRFQKQLTQIYGLPSSTSVKTPIQSGPLTPKYMHLAPKITPSGGEATVHPGPHLKQLQNIIAIVTTHAPLTDVSLIEQAFILAWQGHAGQYRESGDHYIQHPLWVAKKLATFGASPEEIAAALCHDLIEDGIINGQRVTKEFLALKISAQVSFIVQGVTELGKEPEFSGCVSPIDIYKKWLEYGQKDLAIVVIKLADRLHNMRTLAYKERRKQIAKADETLKIYAHIAAILGIWPLKLELEDLSFQYLDPEVYQVYFDRREQIRVKSSKQIDHIKELLKKELALSNIPLAKVIVEARGIYEIYQRVRKNELSADDISFSDIWRIKIVVDTTEDCYRALGVVNSLYPPVQSLFRDFISEPRPNGHQFLHNWVRIPHLGHLLIQINNKEMHKREKIGILAERNWRKRSFSWLTALVKGLKEEITEEKAWEIVAAHSSPIKVYTPKEKVIELPFGSTAVDFARAIHEEVFLHATGAIINGRPAELSQKLQEGDTVWIIINETSWPSLEWMEFVHTPDARSSLRNYLRRKGQVDKISVIRLVIEALDRSSQKYYIRGQQLINLRLFSKYMASLNYHDVESFLFSIGIGERRITDVISGLVRKYQEELKKSKMNPEEMEPFYFTVKARDRVGLFDDLARPLHVLGFNISEFFPVYPEKEPGAVIMVVGVDVFGGRKGGGIVGEVQRTQILNIVKQLGLNEEIDVKVIRPEDATIFLKGKIKRLRKEAKKRSKLKF